MRIIKYFFGFLFVAILLVLIAAIFIGREYSYKKTIHIFSRPEKVWKHISTIKSLNTWNPWLSKDRGMNVLLTGKDGSPGAKICWNSSKPTIGKGCQTLRKLKPFEQVVCQLQLYQPYAIAGELRIQVSAAKVYGSVVSWEYKGKLPYQLRLLRIFTGIKRYLEPDVSQGLGRLKYLCEHR